MNYSKRSNGGFCWINPTVIICIRGCIYMRLLLCVILYVFILFLNLLVLQCRLTRRDDFAKDE